MTTEHRGPAWSEPSFKQKAGRFPLAVEAHVLSMTAKLLPGVTTVTTNARYYALHGLIIDEVSRRDLDYEEGLDFSRKSEVVFALAAALQDEGIASTPHGLGRLQSLVDEDGPWDIGSLSTPKTGYSDTKGGFRGPYIGSEITLGIRDRENVEQPGPRFNRPLVAQGFVGLFDAVGSGEVSRSNLLDLSNLALDPQGQADGEWLTQLLLGELAGDDGSYISPDTARRATAQLLVEAVRQHPGASFNESFIKYVAFGDSNNRAQAEAWRGTVLRWFSVGAWRKLWSWLVDEIDGYTPVDEIGDAFASKLPDSTVGTWLKELPALSTGGTLLPAEQIIQTELSAPEAHLATLLSGGLRSSQLSGRARDAFVGRSSVLGPEWVSDRTDDWHDRRLHDFARFVAEQLFRRSQRVAQKKAYLDRETGRLTSPTRVHVNEGLAWKDSREGAADVGLRVAQLGGMLASLGLFERVDGVWVPTDEARRLDD